MHCIVFRMSTLLRTGTASKNVVSWLLRSCPVVPIGAVRVHSSSVENVAFPRKSSIVGQEALKTIDVKKEDEHLAIVSLNRPARGNAFDMNMWNDLVRSFSIIDSDKSIRAVILTGGSKTFSSGMDLSVFAEIQKVMSKEKCEGRRREALGNLIQFLQDTISAPERCHVPVIASITGHCIGGAVDLATACDLRYCTDDATFSIKETDLAMVADIGTLQRLPKLIGDQRSRELAYTGRVFNGKEAEALGLVAKSFGSESELTSHVKAVAKSISEKSPLTIRGIKKTILFTRDHSVLDGLNQVKLWNSAHMLSSDLSEAFNAGMKKETPVYRDD